MIKTHTISEKNSVNVFYGLLFAVAVSFIMTGTHISGIESSFCAVVAGSVSPIYATAVLTGSLLFYFFTGNIVDSLAMIGSLTTIVVSRWIFDSKLPVFKAVTACVCMIISSFTVIISAGIQQPSGFVVHICMSILTGIAVYFLSDVIENGITKIQISGSKGCSYAIIFILLITSLTSLNVWRFNLGRIAGILAILSVTRRYRQSGGALCGIFTTCGTMFCSHNIGATTIFFAASGLITGFFHEFNKIIFGLFFISVNILGLMLIGVNDYSINMLFDVALGTVLFIIMPENLIAGYFPESKNHDTTGIKIVSSKLDSISSALYDIRKNSQHIVNVLKKADYPADNNIRLSALRDKQRMLFAQMQIAEDIISCIHNDISENVKCDLRISEVAQRSLTDRKLDFISAVAYKNKFDRMFIEVNFNTIVNIDCDDIAQEFSEIFMKNFEYYEKSNSRDEYVIVFSEKPVYMVKSFSYQSGACENEPSGDTTICFDDMRGNTYLVISDGMGSGKNAAIDSKITVSLFKRLIMGSIDAVTAINIINSVMLSKSADESFATLDAAKISHDSGELTLIKSGASATLIKHENSVMMVNASTFPIGIVNNTKPFVRKFDFSAGDCIVMLSDGVSDKSYQYIKTLMLDKNADLSNISRRIGDNARKLFHGKRDDITVLAARLELR